MPASQEMRELDGMIRSIELAARQLMDKAQGIQAIERNAARILASAKMLRINICEVVSDD
jgi:hypothetical protein